jgi:hypothetical protein
LPIHLSHPYQSQCNARRTPRGSLPIAKLSEAVAVKFHGSSRLRRSDSSACWECRVSRRGIGNVVEQHTCRNNATA